MRYLRFLLFLSLLALAGLLAGGGQAHAQPANDDFINAIVIPEPLPYTNSQSTADATLETKEPTPSCAPFGAVWHSFTPSAGSIYLLPANVDHDRDVDAVDALFILQYVVGLGEV